MSTVKFEEMKSALENGETQFVIGKNCSDPTVCFALRYGSCNIIYGLAAKADTDLPRLVERPKIVAMSDNNGKDITIVDKYAFDDTGYLIELDKSLQPFFIDERIKAMNKELEKEVLEPYKATLNDEQMDEYAVRAAMAKADEDARKTEISQIRGTVNDVPIHNMVDSASYLEIRCGAIDAVTVAQNYCSSRTIMLLAEKETERLLSEGVLTETERQIAKAAWANRNQPSVTLHLEREGREGSIDIDPLKLLRVIEDNNTLTSYYFSDVKRTEEIINLTHNLLGMNANSESLKLSDIKSVTRGRTTLYKRDSEPFVKKERKRADIYER